MTFELETAANPEGLKRIVIEPVTRVEGHGKVTLLLDDDNRVHQARFHIVEFRGFEKFIQGRPYWEVPVIVQRLCGICPVSHNLGAAKAMDMIVGAQLTPTAEKLRRLMHLGQVLQSHALHFYYLASPDLLFGFDSDVARRNIVGVAAAYPDIARQGVALRKYGQEVIRLTSGKRIHGTGAIPGGVNKNLSPEERDSSAEGHRPDGCLEPGCGGTDQEDLLRPAGLPQRFRLLQILLHEPGAGGWRPGPLPRRIEGQGRARPDDIRPSGLQRIIGIMSTRK